eukprot:scaffold803_cov310-Pinguiococcus_pyrenoidosus.AAC.67
MEPSSTVMSTSLSRARDLMRSRSRGFMNRASATVTLMPSFSNSSAAMSAELSLVPIRLASRGNLVDVVAEEVAQRLQAVARAARVAHRAGLVVDADLGLHHVHELDLIAGRHNHNVREGAQVGQVEGSVVRRSVVADEPGAIQDEANRQLLEHGVVHDLVVSPLQEGAVDAAERLQALAGHARREGHGVLLGDADVVGALREAPSEDVHSRAAGHGRGDADDLAVIRGRGDERVGEDAGEAGGAGRRLELLARAHVKLGHAVVLVRGALGRRVAIALLGLQVQQDGLLHLVVADVLQDGDEVVQVVAVHGANVVEAQLLEEGAAGHDATGVLVDLLVHLLDLLRHELVEGLGDLTDVLKRLRRHQARRVGRQRARGHGARYGRRARGQGHLHVVVEDDQHAAVEVAGVVHGLVGHAAGDRAVSDDRHAVVVLLLELALRLGHAERGRDAGGGVAGAEGVVLGLLHLGEARDAAVLAQRVHAVTPPREDLVRVHLVAHVPADLVVGRVEHGVQSHRQLHHAQGGAQVPPGLAHRIQHLPAQLVRQLLQLAHGQVLHVLGAIHAVQKRLARRPDEGPILQRREKSARARNFRGETCGESKQLSDKVSATESAAARVSHLCGARLPPAREAPKRPGA